MVLSVEILIDHREKCLKELFETYCQDGITVNFMNLEHGDIHIKNNDVTFFIFERKTLADLKASIHDGRYHNQKRCLMTTYHKEQIAYIIEGKLSYKDECSALVSAVINTMLRDKLSVFVTQNMTDTYHLIQNIAKRVLENPDKYNVHHGGVSVDVVPPQGSKKESAYVNILCQIPSVSLKTAKAVQNTYPTFQHLLESLQELDDDEKLNKLKCITTKDSSGTTRKISSTAALNIVKTFFDGK